MRFYTTQECESWLSGMERQRPDVEQGVPVETINYPPNSQRLFYFARWISKSLTFESPTLLWITEWDIWGNTENWHLYYKLRHTYGDHRLLHEAPGHLFLGYETEDLASFLQLAMLNGWGGYVLTQAGYVNVFFSHDEYIRFYAKDYSLADIRNGLGIEQPVHPQDK